MGISSQQNAVMLANVCAGKQKDSRGNWVEPAGTMSIFLDDTMMNVSPLAVSAILKLADILDCNPVRLLPPESLKQYSMPDILLKEYFKNELVRQVKIGDNGAIRVKLCMNYRYPECYGDVQKAVRTELEGDIRDARGSLKKCGIIMPEPTFDSEEAIFMEDHPFLCQDDQN
jgi:hypothetical protein